MWQNFPTHSKIGMMHVRGLDCFRKTERDSLKFVCGHVDHLVVLKCCAAHKFLSRSRTDMLVLHRVTTLENSSDKRTATLAVAFRFRSRTG